MAKPTRQAWRRAQKRQPIPHSTPPRELGSTPRKVEQVFNLFLMKTEQPQAHKVDADRQHGRLKNKRFLIFEG
jgi:hypothetical protein